MSFYALRDISFLLFAVLLPVMPLRSIAGLSVCLAIPASFKLAVIVSRAV